MKEAYARVEYHFDECPKGRGSAAVKNPTDPIVQALSLVTDRRDGQEHSMLDHRHLAAVEDRAVAMMLAW
jgi:hypothetical protein